MIDRLRFAQHRATTVHLFGENWLNVPVTRFPHYRYLANRSAFREYLEASWQTTVGVDEHIKKYEEQLAAALRDRTLAPITVCARGDDLLVADGNHRAAIAAFLGLPLHVEEISLAEYVCRIALIAGSRYGAPNGIPYQLVRLCGKPLLPGRRTYVDREALIRMDDIAGQRVLDIGTNLGAAAFWAHEAGAASVTGWDIDAQLVTSALRLAVAFGYPVTFRVVDAARPPAGEWDTGFCFSVHEHAGVRASLLLCRVVYLETHRPTEPPAELVRGFAVQLLGGYADGGRRRLYRLTREAV